MDNYEQPTRRQMRPTETEDVAVKVRLHILGNGKGNKFSNILRTYRMVKSNHQKRAPNDSPVKEMALTGHYESKIVWLEQADNQLLSD